MPNSAGLPWWVAFAACTGADVNQEPVSGEPGLALAQAEITPWEQRLWFQGAPGEAVEGITLTEAGTPLVTLTTTAGQWRTVRLARPGGGEAADQRVPARSRQRSSSSSSPGGYRGAVKARDGVVKLTLTDLSGGGTTVLIRDAEAEVSLLNPSPAPGGTAVYVEESGLEGGIWRAGADGSLSRIVPERQVGTPLAWGDADGERVLYVEELPGQPPRVLSARPPGEASTTAPVPPQGAWVAVEQLGDRLMRVDRCAASAPLSLSAVGAGYQLEPGALPFTGARSCGDGCRDLTGPSPAGAIRLQARVEAAEGGGSWWTVPGAGTGHHMPASEATSVPRLDACRPVPPLWRLHRVLSGNDREHFLALDTTRGPLKVLGERGHSRLPFVALIEPSGQVARTQMVGKRHVLPDPTVVVLSEDETAEIVEGAVRIRRTGGDPQVLLAADPAQTPAALALGTDGASLFVADAAGTGTVSRIDGRTGAMVPLVRGLVGSGLAAFSDRRAEVLAVLAGDPASLWLARELEPAERHAWKRGALGLLEVPARWAAVRPLEGLTRCEPGGELTLSVTDGVATLASPAGGLTAVAALHPTHGGHVFLDAGPGGAVTWSGALIPHGEAEGVVRLELPTEHTEGPWWLPEADARALPSSPCD